ncbi:MAG: histidine kinase [Bacteroidia bacterium]|nr:histidine kinase [Bacteroidia bacterium]
MKNFKQPIIIFFLIGCTCFTSLASLSLSQGIGFKNKSKTANDTSDVNRYIRNALAYFPESRKNNYMNPNIDTPELNYIDYIKANIDTAELICVENNIEFPSLLHLARAEYFFLTSDYRSSSVDATIAMKKSNSSGETDVLAKTMNFLGRYSLRTGFYQESIDYFNNSIAIAKKNKLRGIIPRNYDRLKDVYDALGNLKEFRNTLYKLIDAASKENDTVYLEIGYWRLGTSLTDKERDFSLADSLLKICLDISLIRKDTTFIALSLANLGWNNYTVKKYDSAIKYYNRSLTYSIPAKIYFISDNSFGNIGTIYRDMGDTEKSLKNYHKSIDQAKLGEDVYSLSWVYQDMSEMYLRIRDTSNAYKSYVLFKKYSDAQIKTANNQGLTDAKIRYEADTHNKEVELLSLKLRNQRLMIYGYTGLFVLILAIGILILSRAKINAKRRMSEMNRKISEVTQANLRQQMNPHFIFNTLNSIQYYMYQHDKLATNNYLTKFSSLMRKVLENSQHTSVPLRDELDALNLYMELEMIRFKDKFDYEIKVDDEIDTLLYKVPTMLIQPYVENSICHGLMPGEGKGSLKIDLKLEKEYISCTIKDNGIGREAAQEKKRKSENNHNSLGTQIATSRLDLVNALYGTSLKTIYTDLKNENGEPEGTRVEIQIPIMT